MDPTPTPRPDEPALPGPPGASGRVRGRAAGGVVRPAIVYALLFGAAGAYLPYVPIYLGSTGLDLGAVGALIALQAAVMLVAAPSWGAIADGIGDVRRPLLVAGVLAALATLLLLAASGPLAIAVAIVLLAATSAGMIPLVDSGAVRMVSQRDKFGQARAVGSAAFVVVAIFTGAALVRFGPIGMFGTYSVLLLLTGLAAFVLMRAPDEPSDGGRRRRRASPARVAGMALAGLSPATILGVVRQPAVGAFFLAAVVIWLSYAALQNFVSIRLLDLGGDETIVGITSSLSAIVEVPLMTAFPAFARRFGPERLVVVGAFGFAARALISGLATDPAVVAGAAVFGGLGFSFVYLGTVSWVAGAVRREVQATAQGVFSGTAFSLGSMGGAILGGAIGAAFSLPVLFVVSAAGCVLGGLIVWFGVSRGRRDERAVSRA